MAASGLSRRRVNAATGNSGSADPDDNTNSWSNSGSTSQGANGGLGGSRSNSSSNVNGLGGSGGSSDGPRTAGGSAFERGSKIAYDPRDLDGANEDTGKLGGKLPKLTIMEEVLLLGIKDKQGYLSFWNDNISYALRGCILIELALRRRVSMVKDSSRRRLPISERLIEVIDERPTGETILDEALKMMKAQEGQRGEGEKMSIANWIDLLSGETWNMFKYGFQLKQVRERLAKGLVDKGILRTEKRNFLLFDMATHPLADTRTKEAIVTRVVNLFTFTTSSIPPRALLEEGTQCRVVRGVATVCAAYAGSVLDGACGMMTYEQREAAFARCDDILAEFSVWPFGSYSATSSPGGGSEPRRRGSASRGGDGMGARDSVMGLVEGAMKESRGEEDTCFELVAGVLEVLSKLDSLL